jgi:hypothetical protein
MIERRLLFEHAPPVQESEGPSIYGALRRDIARGVHTIERALRLIGEALEPLPGAKSVVLVGHGFGRLGLGGVYMEREYSDAREALRSARAAVFSLDVTDADYHSLEHGLQLASEETGGFFERTHLFSENAVARVAAALEGHYVLIVERPAGRRDEHTLDVRLRRGEGDVYAPTRYVDRQ